MKNMQKLGAAAALVDAATYLVSMALLFTLLTPFGGEMEFGQFMAFFLDNQAVIFAWHVLMYLVNGVALVILALALYERLKNGAPVLAKVSVVLGLAWAVMVFASGFITIYGFEVMGALFAKEPAQAQGLKLAFETITTGLDHSDRFLGCLWVLLTSWAALRTRLLPKKLNLLGIIIAVPGLISTLVPSTNEMAYAFGMGIIVWWLWLGFVLLRKGNEPV